MTERAQQSVRGGPREIGTAGELRYREAVVAGRGDQAEQARRPSDGLCTGDRALRSVHDMDTKRGLLHMASGGVTSPAEERRLEAFVPQNRGS